MIEWFNEHQGQLIWGTVLSAAFCIISLVVAGAVTVRLPCDYFTPEAQRRREAGKRWTAGRIGKNILGWLLIAAGAAMLVLPGQGVLVLLMGVMLADFPGKYRVEVWIVSRKKVLRTMNAVRRWFGREPLASPGGPGSAGATESAPS